MKRYMIEREIPGIGAMSVVELCGASRASNQAIGQLGGEVQWQHGYVAGDKTFCVHLARDEAAVRRHAERAASPRPRSPRCRGSSTR
jgi:hypothetical protein